MPRILTTSAIEKFHSAEKFRSAEKSRSVKKPRKRPFKFVKRLFQAEYFSESEGPSDQIKFFLNSMSHSAEKNSSFSTNIQKTLISLNNLL